jgi:hypothetical protein
MGSGSFEWISTEGVLGFSNNGITVLHNFTAANKPLPSGKVILRSGADLADLAPNETVWIS